MNSIIIWIYKDDGTFYAEEKFEVPANLHTPIEITEYVIENFSDYKGKTLVLPLQEPFVTNWYPCMITADQR